MSTLPLRPGSFLFSCHLWQYLRGDSLSSSHWPKSPLSTRHQAEMATCSCNRNSYEGKGTPSLVDDICSKWISAQCQCLWEQTQNRYVGKEHASTWDSKTNSIVSWQNQQILDQENDEDRSLWTQNANWKLCLCRLQLPEKTKAKDACPKVQKKNQRLQSFFPR